MIKKLIRNDFFVVYGLALLYYAGLASQYHTNIFFSGDNGDWLAASTWWFVPQPYGSPLYITLGHLLNALPFSTLVAKMTFWLSVIPAAITVGTVYLIVKKLVNMRIAIVCSFVLLGSAIYLTQATVLEEFAISSMFVTLAYYFYIQNKKKLTILMLALGSAVQIIVVLISALWFLLHIKELKAWYKNFWIYIVFGLLPYGLIILMMYLPTPRLLSGSLSWANIDNYLGATGTMGSLSLMDAPERLLNFAWIFLVSLGLALIPLFVSFKGLIKLGKNALVALATVVFLAWIYLTDNDPGTWHFLPIAYPLSMILVAWGLQRMPKVNYRIVAISGCFLMMVNCLFLNASILAGQYPLAARYEQDVRNLPDGSYLITASGGNYGLDNYYIMASGKDIRPIFFDSTIADVPELSANLQEIYKWDVANTLVGYGASKSAVDKQVEQMLKNREATLKSPRYQGYLQWMQEKYNLQGNNTIAQVSILLEQNKDVYIVLPCITPFWQGIFQYDNVSQDLGRVTGVLR